ncbi:hypothetical protein B0H12DRAFT_1077443 [Mycena haematopus]|nr:hypothetical protein B0H12DRAFT_1077443 [Mycena haematopus]
MAYLVIPAVIENYWGNVDNEFCTAMKTDGYPVVRSLYCAVFPDAPPLSPPNSRPHHSTRTDHNDGIAGDDTIFPSYRDNVARIAPTFHVNHEWAAFCSNTAHRGRRALLVAGAGTGHRARHKYVYRCYLVWGRPRKIFVVVPILLMLGTLATGYVTSYDEDYSNGPYHFDPRIVFTLNLFTNFVMMMLTAGRIWWVTRTQRDVFGTEFTPRYSAAIAIILESGAIYCCGLVFQVIALSLQDSIPTAVYLSHGTIGQLVNIVPTLIVVRVGMGHAAVTTAPGDSASTTVPRSRIHNTSRPLRFASAAFSRSDAEYCNSELCRVRENRESPM